MLHMGSGTFRPVEVEDLTKHKMDSEYLKLRKTLPILLIVLFKIKRTF
jgi:S-adenosylmethionine:tRNA-ribosyltransferase-isomerase (queuine synthetase)